MYLRRGICDVSMKWFNLKGVKSETIVEEAVDIQCSWLGTSGEDDPRYLACYVEEMMDHCSPEFACKPV